MENNTEIKIGMKLMYAGKEVTVKDVNKTHVLITFENGGKAIVVDRFGFKNKIN